MDASPRAARGGVRAPRLPRVRRALRARVCIDPEGATLRDLRPAVVVDGRMAKRNLGTRPSDARLVIGLGPGISRARRRPRGDRDAARAWSWGGCAGKARRSRIPGAPPRSWGDVRIGVLRAPWRPLPRRARDRRPGRGPATSWPRSPDVPWLRASTGLLRGLLGDGVSVEQGVKVGDVDPRGREVDPCRISEKGRAIAAGTLEAILQDFTVLNAP